MEIYTKEAWAKKQYKGQWEDSRFNRDRVEAGELPAYYIGRRYLMVNDGSGTSLITEGIHFLIEGDYSSLPILHKSNAMVGAAYQFGGGVQFVQEIYRISEDYAREHDLACLDRVKTNLADFALPGGDIATRS